MSSSEPPSSHPIHAVAAAPLDTPLPSLWRVTWPLFISLGLSLSLHFTDAIFLSRISDAAAAAAGAINPLLGATLVLFAAVGQAGASIAGRLHGAGRHAELPLTHYSLLVFNLAVGLLVSALLFVLHPFVPGWLGLRGDAESSARTYMAVLGGFQVFKAVQLAYGNMLNSRGETRWVMLEAVATNVANISLNLALTHHVLGFGPTVGRVAGATVASLLFGMLFTIGVVHLRFKVRFPLDCHWPELWRSLKPVLRIGLPSASEPISYQLAQITINLLVISLGAAALAARTYVSSFVMVSSVLWSFALGVGTQIAISHRLGAGKLEEADAQLTRSLTYAVIGNGVAALVLALLHRPLLGLLTRDPEIVRLAAPLFAIGVLVEMGRAVNIVAGGALKSAGDAKFSAIVGASLMWLLGVPSAYLLGGTFGLSLGLTGVWISMALDEIVRGVVNYRRWKAGHWRTTSELAPRLTTLASE